MLYVANILQRLLELNFQILKTCDVYGWICNYWHVSIQPWLSLLTHTSPIPRVF